MPVLLTDKLGVLLIRIRRFSGAEELSELYFSIGGLLVNVIKLCLATNKVIKTSHAGPCHAF